MGDDNFGTLQRSRNVLYPVVVILSILLVLSLVTRPREGLSKRETQRAVAEILVAAEPCEATDAFTVTCTMDALDGKLPPTTLAPSTTTPVAVPLTTTAAVTASPPKASGTTTSEDPTK